MEIEPVNINTLTRKRGYLKGRITIFKQFIDEVSNRSEEEISPEVLEEVCERLERLKHVSFEIGQVQDQIDLLTVEDAGMQTQIAERECNESSLCRLIAKTNVFLKKFTRTPGEIGSSSSYGSVHSGNRGNVTGDEVKLPRIDLPKFKGDFDNWLEFRDTFRSLIHENLNLGNIQRFHYLRASLEGTAAQVIHSLEFSAENYTVAWESLCDRFNNTRLLVDNHLKKLFGFAVLSNESASELRKMGDMITKHLRALELLGQPTSQWDTLIIFNMSAKLDKKTVREWEEIKSKMKNDEVPSLSAFKTFLKGRADLLDTLQPSQRENKQLKTKSFVANRASGVTNAESVCYLCKGNHSIYKCQSFLQFSPNERAIKVRELQLCLNCLKPNHISRNCSFGSCQKCKAKHHTLIHFERNSEVQFGSGQRSDTNSYSGNSVVINHGAPVGSAPTQESRLQSLHSFGKCNVVLLSTAIVKIRDIYGKLQPVRALLDSASQCNFISEECCRRLGIPKVKTRLTVSGIGQMAANLFEKCHIQVQANTQSFNATVSCFVLPMICGSVPEQEVEVSQMVIPPNLGLADPTFHKPGQIDLLIGAEMFYTLLCAGQYRCGQCGPILQKTKLGWVVSGPINNNKSTSLAMCNLSVNSQLLNQLSQFWEVEEVSSSASGYSSEEKMCERVFVETTRRDKEGRFIVRMPLKQGPEALGESRQNALKCFLWMERKLANNSTLRNQYVQFMREYIQLGHMSKVNDDDKAKGLYYLPHHAVVNEASTTTKLRVVFNASSPSTSGISLNNIQCVGPTIQNELFLIILRFREHKFVVCSDISKMYRQVWIDSEQRDLQRILWRENPLDPIGEYNLNTVTYGEACAPFLAIRCLYEIAEQHKHIYPQASEVIKENFYVDDFIGGGNSVGEVVTLSNQVRTALRTGRFELAKWKSNSQEVLKGLNEGSRDNSGVNFGDKAHSKTLGLFWSCQEDVLTYEVTKKEISRSVTKRSILSQVASIFDPLGLVGPCIVLAKIILQQLWLLKVSWDESVPLEVHTKWQKIRSSLTDLNTFKIPRRVLCDEVLDVQLHAFCDASMEAYGSCIFLRSTSTSGKVQTALLCSKSRIAPLKTLTIPRLELCSAVLLVKLVEKVINAIKIPISEMHFWSDSTVVLCWIGTSLHQLQPFVSHRVSQIQSFGRKHIWHHVGTSDNPADTLSRGALPRQLINNELWWNGPRWLKGSEEEWPKFEVCVEGELPEIRKNVKVFVVHDAPAFPFERFSSLVRLKRTVAWCIRFIHNCRSSKEHRRVDPFKVEELNDALLRLIKISQRDCFKVESESLRKGIALKPGSALLKLNPFLSDKGLIQVGGRLQNAQFSLDKKHPIVLSGKHHLTKLIFCHEHLRLWHASPQTLLASVRQRYWPIGGRVLARVVVHKCIVCVKARPKVHYPIMGNLPEERVTPTYPFYISGTDYAGPLWIKDRKGRGSKKSKCYVCIFICFTTKAIHLELVSDLTTEAFIACLKRFVSRRGKPKQIYSDNGSNFIGANNQLVELQKFLKCHGNEIVEECTKEEITWSFIPPHSPHFGGLWEAGVKSFKTYLLKIMGNSVFTFEEMYTALTQVEAILNSRPLVPLSNDPNDLQPLTAAHFVIGRPITSVPDYDFCETKDNRLSRFELVQKTYQHLWKRWSQEYVSELQQRQKWRVGSENVQEGKLVVLKEENQPPLKWKLGRIVQLHPGVDGVVRVVSVKTASGVIKRAVAKICVLPVD